MKRNEVENKYKWDLSAMVESDEKLRKVRKVFGESGSRAPHARRV